MNTVFAIFISAILPVAAFAQQYESVKILDDNIPTAGEFGYSVSINGDTMLIGAPRSPYNGLSSGSAHVYVYVDSVWNLQGMLLPDDGAEDDYFGASVSISGDIAVVGADSDDDNGELSGAVYVFTRAGGVWSQQAKITPDDGAAGDFFGGKVSIEDDVLVVSAAGVGDGATVGAAYVFALIDGAWVQQAKLYADSGSFYDGFGSRVAVSGETVVVSAPRDDEAGAGPNSGAIYVYVREADRWECEAKLVVNDAVGGEALGWSLGIDQDTVVAGAPFCRDYGANSGAAYVFAREAGVWTQRSRLLPEGVDERDEFGSAVAVKGGLAVVGAWKDDDNGFDSGAAYLYKNAGGEWRESVKLLSSDGDLYDRFGYGAALNGDTAIVGAHSNDTDQNWGAVYVFHNVGAACASDLNHDNLVDTRDFIAFLNAWSVGDLSADWDKNGIIDTRDFVAFLNEWVVGC